jgi:hypothetical protein
MFSRGFPLLLPGHRRESPRVIQEFSQKFISGLLAVLAGTDAIAGNIGKMCIVCKTCKDLVQQGFQASC